MEVPHKIKSPKTGRMVTVGKNEYNKLLTHYTENYLLSLGTIQLPSVALPEDVIYTIVLNSEINDIINLYYVNKIYKGVLDKPYVLKALSVKYLNNDVFTFKDFLKTYFNNLQNDKKIKLNLFMIYNILKQFNNATTIDYAIKVAHIIKKVINVFYSNWLHHDLGANLYHIYMNEKYKITKDDILHYLRQDTVLLKFYNINHPKIPIMTQSINHHITITNEAITMINDLIYPIIKQFALNMNAGKQGHPDQFRDIVKKILTRKYERFAY